MDKYRVYCNFYIENYAEDEEDAEEIFNANFLHYGNGTSEITKIEKITEVNEND